MASKMTRFYECILPDSTMKYFRTAKEAMDFAGLPENKRWRVYADLNSEKSAAFFTDADNRTYQLIRIYFHQAEKELQNES